MRLLLSHSDVPFNEGLYDNMPLEADNLDVYQNINRGNINAKLEKAKNDLQYAVDANDVDNIQKLEGMITDYESQLENVPTSDEVVSQDLSNDNVDELAAIEELEKTKADYYK